MATEIKKKKITTNNIFEETWNNPMKKPYLEKIVLNIGVGAGGEELERASAVLKSISGKEPKKMLSKKNIKEFNLRKGRPIGVKVTIRGEDAEKLLMFGMAQALKDAKQFAPNWDELEPIAKTILVDMSYNLGYTKLAKFKNFREALSRLDYDRAKAEMIDSNWYEQVGRRSKRLVSMMDTLAEKYK